MIQVKHVRPCLILVDFFFLRGRGKCFNKEKKKKSHRFLPLSADLVRQESQKSHLISVPLLPCQGTSVLCPGTLGRSMNY